ncbi:MAG: hypothetical protein VYE14_05135 [Verrucomicrobiota bacterium]|nr:hypothetical protein [Verrucomicrobiota bacterium]
MNGYNPRNPNATRWVEYPAHYHDNAGRVTLADGHAVIKKWVDPRTSCQSARASVSLIFVSSPKNAYILWLQHRSAPPKPSRR